jgi:Ca2+-transporting ATPase
LQQAKATMANAWHSKTVDEVLDDLETDPVGLTEQEVEQRLAKYGPNELEERKGISALQIFLSQFKDVFVIMLLIAMAISFATAYYEGESQADTVTITAIVVLNAVVGFANEYRSEQAMEAMRKLTAPKARLMRN